MKENQLDAVGVITIPDITVMSYKKEDAPDFLLKKYIVENQIYKISGFRFLGFFYKNQTERSTQYSYEIWLVVPENFDVPAPFVKKQFKGGLYASILTQENEAKVRLQELYDWVDSSDKYELELSRQRLEECVDYEAFLQDSAIAYALLEPIKLK
jgi:hypothetical protein